MKLLSFYGGWTKPSEDCARSRSSARLTKLLSYNFSFVAFNRCFPRAKSRFWCRLELDHGWNYVKYCFNSIKSAAGSRSTLLRYQRSIIHHVGEIIRVCSPHTACAQKELMNRIDVHHMPSISMLHINFQLIVDDYSAFSTPCVSNPGCLQF